MNKELLLSQLSALPLCQYEFIRPEELTFSERIRAVCESECPMYNKTWACPPAVGSVEACRKKCLSYPDALMITTVTEVPDITDMCRTLATRAPHEEITRQVEKLLRAQGLQTYVLSTEACTHCKTCTWPDAPCRHPDRMYPCVESHGIVVTEIAEKYGIDFMAGNLVVWFSILFFKERGPLRPKEEFAMLSFLKEIVKTAPDIFRSGWAEANAGNISIRLTEAELADRAAFRADAPWQPLLTPVLGLANEYFLVTAAGCQLRNIAADPERTCGVLHIDADGAHYQTVWGLKDAQPTSEFFSHLLSHDVRKRVSGGAEHAVLHTHPATLVAMCHVREFDTRSLTRLLWSMHQEGVCLFPEGIAYLPFQISGGLEISKATCRAFEKHSMVLWEFHGVFASGNTLDHAFGMVQAAEKAAQIYQSACAMGGVRRALDAGTILAVANNFGLIPAPGILDDEPGKPAVSGRVSER